MRATKGYMAGVGTTSALIGAIGCAFAVLSAVVAVHGWPLELNTPGASTVEGWGVEDVGGLPSPGLFPALAGARGGERAGAHGRAVTRRGRFAPAGAGPVASAFGPLDPAAGVGAPETGGSADARTPAVAPAAGAAGAVAGTGGDSGPAPGTATGADGGPSALPPSEGGSSSTLGGTVAEVTGGAGAAVVQTGQQLGGAVQGATGQLGGTAGQVSPAAGQLVTQTGQTAGGVVSGATGAVGQVVAGTGATAGGLLGGGR